MGRSSGKAAGKSSSRWSLYFCLAPLAFFVMLVCWDSFRRSAFMTLDPVVSQKQLLLDAACKPVFVETQCNAKDKLAKILIDRHAIYNAPLTEGVSVVTIDTWKQVAVTKRTYYEVDGATKANDNLTSDLVSLAPGYVVLIAANNFGHILDDSALKALKGLGSSLTKEKKTPKAYVLIGSMGGEVLAESQGTAARAVAVLPCMDKHQSLQPRLPPAEQQRLNLGYTQPEPIAEETAKVRKEGINNANAAFTMAERPQDASSELMKSQDAASASDQTQVASVILEQSEPDQTQVASVMLEQSEPKAMMEDVSDGKMEKSGDAITELEKSPNVLGASDRPTPLEQSKPKSIVEKTNTEDVSEDDVSPETTFRCVGGQGDRSCLFRNLYYRHGQFVMFVLQQPTKPIDVFRANKYGGIWRPQIELFKNVQKIEKRVQGKALIEERGLSVQFDPLFHNNIGHGIFDGLYPAFFATVKLKVQDRPWRPVVAVDPGCFEKVHGGKLMPGDLVEAYLPHPKYGRTLRTLHVKIVRAPEMTQKGPDCKWTPGSDHSGLDLGGTSVAASTDQKAECHKACVLSFGCKACVLFDGTCYLKGKGGGEFPRGDRPGIKVCSLEGGAVPKSDIVVKPVKHAPEAGVEMRDASIPYEWIVGRVNRRCMTEGIYETFGGVGEIRRTFEMERDCRNYPDLLIRFEEIVFGVGGAGNMIADKSGAIGGSLAPHHAMSQFRDRMLRSYGLPVETGVKPVPPDRDLNVIVVSNKRFHKYPEDMKQINTVIQKLNSKNGFNAKMIDWGAIGAPDNKFREHLKATQKADVYVSSIGTALQYVPFMRDGKIFVALGSVWMRSGQYFPTFMEQQLAGGGTPYLRTLYADPGGVLRSTKNYPRLGEDGFFAGVNGTLVTELMRQAEVLLRKGFEIPVAPVENLSVEGRIIVEICKRDDEACKNIINHRNGGHGMALLWNECVVYEVGPWRKGAGCGSAHHKILRELRKEYGIPGYGAPER